MLAVLALIQPASAMSQQDRREYLAKILKILPPAPQFQQWLDKTGELPPDFDALPRMNTLPDPLKFLDGRPVRNAADWKARRAEIWNLYQKYDLGTFPPKPKLDRAVVLDETQGNGYLIRNVRLEFGLDSKATMRVQVMIPNGVGPFPVLISPNLAGGARLCFAAATSRQDTPATMPWTMRPCSTSSIPITISRFCRAALGLPGWSSISGNSAAGRQEAHRHVRLFARRKDGRDRDGAG